MPRKKKLIATTTGQPSSLARPAAPHHRGCRLVGPSRAGGWRWRGAEGLVATMSLLMPVPQMETNVPLVLSAGRQRDGSGLNTSSVLLRVGGETGGSGWQRAPRAWPGGPGEPGSARPQPRVSLGSAFTSFSLFFPRSKASGTGPGSQRCHNARGWRRGSGRGGICGSSPGRAYSMSEQHRHLRPVPPTPPAPRAAPERRGTARREQIRQRKR